MGVFALGAILLARKQVVVAAGPAQDSNDYSRPPASRSPSQKTEAASASPNQSASSLDSVNAAVATSLDYLKEQLFRLELRHQAGTISDEDYASERARAEKVLRDLVRG
jgi:hypothetical protein